MKQVGLQVALIDKKRRNKVLFTSITLITNSGAFSHGILKVGMYLICKLNQSQRMDPNVLFQTKVTFARSIV